MDLRPAFFFGCGGGERQDDVTNREGQGTVLWLFSDEWVAVVQQR